MAEFVEKRCEDMIPELEHLERLKIFDKNEIRGISKKFKEFEYKIQRHQKCKEDYLRYIQYEMDLFKLIKQRREKLGIQQKKADIDHAITNKINSLYKEAIFKFQDDIRFWIAYIKFCKHFHFHQSVSHMIGRMLQVHQDKPKCWHIVALWELEENKNKQSARQYLLRGLHLHPDSQLLFIDTFRLELEDGLSNKQSENAENQEEDAKSSEDDDMPSELKRAYVVYRQAFKRIKDIKFIIQLLDVVQEFGNTEKLQNKMVSDMIEEYAHEPLMWDTMARRELAGSTPGDADKSSTSPSKRPSLRDRITSCNQVYQTAVKRIKTEEMWSLYIDCLLEINHDGNTLPNFKRKLLKNALSQMHQAKKLKEKYYLHWIHMLSNDNKQDESNDKKLNEILCSATESIPGSVNLWHARLKYLLLSERETEADEVFNKATQVLGEKALSLWRMRLLYAQANSPEKTEEIFKAAMQKDPVIAKNMKPSYVEWLALMQGINATRKAYDELCLQPPTCLELHKKMASIETMQPEVVVKQARKPFEMAVMQFGQNHVDVWIDYILFEIKYGDPKKVGDIHRNAVKTLEPSLTDSFIAEYSLLKANPEFINKL